MSYKLIFKTDTFNICKHKLKEEYWFYDNIQGYNIVMGAKSKDEAFSEAICYYQKRFISLKEDSKRINNEINTFINLMAKEDFFDLEEEEEY